jgi:FkbM family methyltransferase
MNSEIITVKILGKPCSFIRESNLSYRDKNGKRKGPILDEIERNEWESDIFQLIFDQRKNATHFVDAGAWIGPFSVFARRLGYEVVSIEADPRACAMLIANLSINKSPRKKVAMTYFAALSSLKKGLVTLHTVDLADSETSVFNSTLKRGRVRTAKQKFYCGRTTLEEATSELPYHKGIVKIDIEGSEYGIAKQIKSLIVKKKPQLVLSLHSEFFIRKNPDSEVMSHTQRLIKGLDGYERYLWYAAGKKMTGNFKDLITFARISPRSITNISCLN